MWLNPISYFLDLRSHSLPIWLFFICIAQILWPWIINNRNNILIFFALYSVFFLQFLFYLFDGPWARSTFRHRVEISWNGRSLTFLLQYTGRFVNKLLLDVTQALISSFFCEFRLFLVGEVFEFYKLFALAHTNPLYFFWLWFWRTIRTRF